MDKIHEKDNKEFATHVDEREFRRIFPVRFRDLDTLCEKVLEERRVIKQRRPRSRITLFIFDSSFIISWQGLKLEQNI